MSHPVVIFAQTPPPEHGQSRMVALMLETLRGSPEDFEIHHVNARFSNTLEDIGEGTLGKMLLTAKYLTQALSLRLRVSEPLLYYVPGPVKWSAVLRDWMLLSVLRLFYRRTVFHWHAIGQGEWAHGSERLSLEGPPWLDKLARKCSARVFEKPFASIAVCPTSRCDSATVGSLREMVVCNGIADPCPDFEETVLPALTERRLRLSKSQNPCFQILFLSHGTLEKGIVDALECMIALLEKCDPRWCFKITFAGGISSMIRLRFDFIAEKLRSRWPDRVEVRERDYLRDMEKRLCFTNHDVFLAPSHWESFGLTVCEAMACGMEIVAAASDGVKGLLPEHHPYIAPVATPEILSEKLRDCCKGILEHPEVRSGQALRARFLEFYQIAGFTRNITAAFRELSRQAAFPAHEPAANGPAETARAGDGKLSIQVYLADQNPGHDRSYGISRMSQAVLEALHGSGRVAIRTITSRTSQQPHSAMAGTRVLPWGTRRKTVRLLTDHLHPLFGNSGSAPDVHYYPKGYLPILGRLCRPSVVTIHDTIIQYDEDHYPAWRNSWEYAYWALMLKHTLRSADRILTVSESSKRQILSFMERHNIPAKSITVTYEPCMFESIPQPADTTKENYVIHLASCEPHKRSAHLIRWWHEAETRNREMPTLHLIGTVPPEVDGLLSTARTIVKRPFLEDKALIAAYRQAKALILPSEIEGFGLPALEAYYLGTPVCFVKDTSVEEILATVTSKGAFSLDDSESLFKALDEVMAMTSAEVCDCGLRLRETYAASKVAARMVEVFKEVNEGRASFIEPPTGQ